MVYISGTREKDTQTVETALETICLQLVPDYLLTSDCYYTLVAKNSTNIYISNIFEIFR